jgi:pyruvate/2-oxoglutarate dehydrogenase complex dihydrolipoamide acyltransferase (E2) component
VSSSSTETLIDLTMPQMGVSVAEGTVVEWKKRIGDWVEADETIVAISTDKIDTDVEAPASGRLADVLVDVGTTVDVGTVLARIATDAKPGEPHVSESTQPASPAEAGGSSAGSAETGTGEAAAALAAPGGAGALQGDAQTDRPKRGPRRYSPVVMRIAAEHGVDLDQVEGTGRDGRVRKQDVLAFVENGPPTAPAEPPMHIESPYRPDEPARSKTRRPRLGREPAPAAAVSAGDGSHAAPLSRMRASIGEHMLHSLRTAATCTTIAEADMTRVEAVRREAGLTSLPYVARAVIEVLAEYPALNATLEDGTLTTYDGVHLGIAVSLGEGGLIVPVIRDAQDLSVEGLARRIKDLARRAREGELSPDEVRGGSFTITNPGGYGSIMATPVINQPQVAILDTEAVVKRPVVVTDELGNDAIVVRSMTYLCMSWDHRALDGAIAAQFLTSVRKKLEAWPMTVGGD